MQNFFGCNLFVDTKEHSPHIVTELTGVDYSRIVVKGTPFQTLSGELIHERPNQSNLWILESGKMFEGDNYYANESIEFVVNVLQQNSEKFKEVFNRFPKKHLLVYSYSYEYNPYFILSKDLISSLSEFKIDVEFDIYLLGKEDREGI